MAWRYLSALASISALMSSFAAEPLAWGLGCNELGYDGKPPSPPFPKLGLSARIGLTTVWESP